MPAEPLLRLLGRCTTHDTDMASCQAKLAEGATNCFIYMQEDALTLGTIGVEAEHLIESTACRSSCRSRRMDHRLNQFLLLADLRLVGGSGAGGAQITIEAGGGCPARVEERIPHHPAAKISILDSLTTTELLGTPATAASPSPRHAPRSTTSISSSSATWSPAC